MDCLIGPKNLRTEWPLLNVQHIKIHCALYLSMHLITLLYSLFPFPNKKESFQLLNNF